MKLLTAKVMMDVIFTIFDRLAASFLTRTPSGIRMTILHTLS